MHANQAVILFSSLSEDLGTFVFEVVYDLLLTV